nr:MAG TPA: holin family protein [Caudoviricetes sp.]
MSKIIYIVIITVLVSAIGNMWWENKKEVERLEQEFTSYKEKTNERLKVLDELQKDVNEIRSGFVAEQSQAMKDSVRGNIVAQKPKLVESKLNESFKEFTKEFKEITQ